MHTHSNADSVCRQKDNTVSVLEKTNISASQEYFTKIDPKKEDWYSIKVAGKSVLTLL
jgi:hypothetical protein